MINLGPKIKLLRKQKNISQEVLAQYLGVSFQAVSKWETETAMPDVTLIPAIASFFNISTDELFDFNLLEIQKNVADICAEASNFRLSDPAKSEKILRSGLKKYPGNDILLNNLLYTLQTPDRSDELIDICTALIESTKYDDVKYDALRILAETYKQKGEYELIKSTLNRIPEIYFTKLELEATLLDGPDKFKAADYQKSLSFESLLNMLLELANYYESIEETDKALIQLNISKNLIIAFKSDFATTLTFSAYECFLPRIEEIDANITRLQN